MDISSLIELLQCETIHEAHPSMDSITGWEPHTLTHEVSFRIHLANVLCGEHCIMLRNISQLFIRMKFMARFHLNPIRPSEIVLHIWITHSHIYSNPATGNNGRWCIRLWAQVSERERAYEHRTLYGANGYCNKAHTYISNFRTLQATMATNKLEPCQKMWHSVKFYFNCICCLHCCMYVTHSAAS